MFTMKSPGEQIGRSSCNRDGTIVAGLLLLVEALSKATEMQSYCDSDDDDFMSALSDLRNHSVEMQRHFHRIFRT